MIVSHSRTSLDRNFGSSDALSSPPACLTIESNADGRTRYCALAESPRLWNNVDSKYQSPLLAFDCFGVSGAGGCSPRRSPTLRPSPTLLLALFLRPARLWFDLWSFDARFCPWTAIGCFLPAHNIIWLRPLSWRVFTLRPIDSFRQVWTPVGGLAL